MSMSAQYTPVEKFTVTRKDRHGNKVVTRFSKGGEPINLATVSRIGSIVIYRHVEIESSVEIAISGVYVLNKIGTVEYKGKTIRVHSGIVVINGVSTATQWTPCDPKFKL